jgi:hypothetical protein
MAEAPFPGVSASFRKVKVKIVSLSLFSLYFGLVLTNN